ncbi:MAG: hypothetical protein DI592_09390 [Stenotrophomonas maltophilia]|nr:MAG: hypothetical protein DI592_09390 [Stenotrophomonas maltophilia]
MDRRLAVHSPCNDVCACTGEQGHRLGVPGYMQRLIPLVIARRGIKACFQKFLKRARVRLEERGSPSVIPG